MLLSIFKSTFYSTKRTLCLMRGASFGIYSIQLREKNKPLASYTNYHQKKNYKVLKVRNPCIVSDGIERYFFDGCCIFVVHSRIVSYRIVVLKRIKIFTELLNWILQLVSHQFAKVLGSYAFSLYPKFIYKQIGLDSKFCWYSNCIFWTIFVFFSQVSITMNIYSFILCFS